MLTEMTERDSPDVLKIYQMGLETRNATFETTVPSWEIWNSKHHKHSRLVYIENTNVVGWAALSPTSAREVYGGVAEVSIYVHANFKGRGIGSQLMEKLLISSEENGIWSLFSSVFPENSATIKLHEKFGFRVLGYREKIAQLDGKWRNTVLLERRSKKIGF